MTRPITGDGTSVVPSHWEQIRNKSGSIKEPVIPFPVPLLPSLSHVTLICCDLCEHLTELINNLFHVSSISDRIANSVLRDYRKHTHTHIHTHTHARAHAHLLLPSSGFYRVNKFHVGHVDLSWRAVKPKPSRIVSKLPRYEVVTSRCDSWTSFPVSRRLLIEHSPAAFWSSRVIFGNKSAGATFRTVYMYICIYLTPIDSEHTHTASLVNSLKRFSDIGYSKQRGFFKWIFKWILMCWQKSI